MTHLPVHVVYDALPSSFGFTLRTHQLVSAQKTLGMAPIIILEPEPNLPDEGVTLLEGIAVYEEDGIEYYRLSESRPLRRMAVKIGQAIRKRGVRGGYRFTPKLPTGAAGWERLIHVMSSRLKDRTVVHGHTPHPTAFRGLQLAKRLHVPFVYEVRGFWEASVESSGGREIDGMTFDQWKRADAQLAKDADWVITLGLAMKDELINRGVDGDKISIVGNAVDPDKFAPTVTKDPELSRQLRTDGRFVIGYVSSVEKMEGIDVLLRAHQILVRKGYPASVLLVGEGSQISSLRKLAIELGTSAQVHFPGWVPHSTVTRYYSMFDVFVVPRIDAQVCRLVTPLKPLEALVLGLPVVVSDLPALTELVKPGERGLTFRAGDPADLAQVLERLYHDPGLRRDLGDRARSWVLRERTWARMASLTYAIYEDLCKS